MIFLLRIECLFHWGFAAFLFFHQNHLWSVCNVILAALTGCTVLILEEIRRR
jgi:hypothetical protein